MKDTHFKRIRFILELFDSFPALRRNQDKGSQMEEIVIPPKLDKYSIDMSSRGGWFRPCQNMANKISVRFADAKATYPPYPPYTIPDPASGPWLPDNPEYRRRLPAGRNAKTQEGNTTQPLPTQEWILNRSRFIITADFCRARQPFGCAISQFDALSRFLHHATTDVIYIALAYGSILQRRLGWFARDRASNIDYFRYIIVGKIGIKRAVISDAITLTSSKKGPKGRARGI